MFTLSCITKYRISLGCALFLSGAMTAGCASTEPVVKTTQTPVRFNPVDPYEGFNRSMYGFNMGVDKYLLKPISDGYRFVTPDFMQTGVTNFFNNLKGINVVINDLLQGKVEQGFSDTGRFLTNSTIGVFGLFDVASDLGLEANVEDFGQTLAVWGVGQGPYLVLPILGPTTVRDGSAIIVDKAANPGTYVPGTGIIEGINERANAEGALNFINEAALDPYVFTRESFLQYRTNLINDGKVTADDFDLDIDEALDSEGAGSSNAAIDLASDPEQSANVEAFENMNKSFDEALSEFEAASAMMDKAVESRMFRRYSH